MSDDIQAGASGEAGATDGGASGSSASASASGGGTSGEPRSLSVREAAALLDDGAAGSGGGEGSGEGGGADGGEGKAAADAAASTAAVGVEPPGPWAKEHRALWDTLPEPARAAILAREAEVAKLASPPAEHQARLQAELAEVVKAKESVFATLTHLQQQGQAAIEAEFGDIKTVDDVTRMAEEEPARFLRWQALQMKLGDVERQRAAMIEEARGQQKQRTDARLREEGEKLAKVLPEWADPEKGKVLRGEIKTFLVSQGFDPKELGGLVDHRLVVVANKARLWDAAQAAKSAIAADKTIPPVTTPGPSAGATAATIERNKAMSRLRQSGSIKDAALALESML